MKYDGVRFRMCQPPIGILIHIQWAHGSSEDPWSRLSTFYKTINRIYAWRLMNPYHRFATTSYHENSDLGNLQHKVDGFWRTKFEETAWGEHGRHGLVHACCAKYLQTWTIWTMHRMIVIILLPMMLNLGVNREPNDCGGFETLSIANDPHMISSQLTNISHTFGSKFKL